MCYIIHFCILLFINILTTLQNQTVLHQFQHGYLEFDGIYDIAGEVVVGNRADGTTKSYKYYKKVRRGQAAPTPSPSTPMVNPSMGTSTPGLVETRSEDDA